MCSCTTTMTIYNVLHILCTMFIIHKYVHFISGDIWHFPICTFLCPPLRLLIVYCYCLFLCVVLLSIFDMLLSIEWDFSYYFVVVVYYQFNTNSLLVEQPLTELYRVTPGIYLVRKIGILSFVSNNSSASHYSWWIFHHLLTLFRVFVMWWKVLLVFRCIIY